MVAVGAVGCCGTVGCSGFTGGSVGTIGADWKDLVVLTEVLLLLLLAVRLDEEELSISAFGAAGPLDFASVLLVNTTTDARIKQVRVSARKAMARLEPLSAK
jgi:hypothetical protein